MSNLKMKGLGQEIKRIAATISNRNQPTISLLRGPSIGTYQSISHLISDDPTWQEVITTVATISGVTEDEVKLLSIPDLEKVYSDFMTSTFVEEGALFNHVITIDGKEYGILDVQNMTVGEMASIETLAAAEKKDSELHRVMSIMYRPLVSRKPFMIEVFNENDFEDRAKLFQDSMPISVAIKTNLFFLETLEKLRNNTQVYSVYQRHLIQNHNQN